MKKTIFGKGFLLAAVMLAALAACAATYEVTGDVTDLDLTTGAYDADRLIGPAPGGDPRTLSGTLTHATATLENPFCLIGNPANTATSDKVGQLNLDVTGIDATTPLSFSGYGIFCLDQMYQIDANWSDSYLQTDGNATGYFYELRLANQDITLDRDNPSNLYRLLYGPNQAKRKKDGGNTVSAQCRNLYVGYGDVGSASLTLRNTSLTVYDNFKLGVKATTDSASAAVHGSLVLDHAVLDVYGSRQDFETGSDCLNNSSHLGATNVVVLGAESRLLARRIYQKKAPSLLFTFAGGTLETSWSRSNHDHQLFTSSDNGRIVVTNAPGCDFRFKVSSSEYYPLANSHVSIAGDGDFVKLGSGDLRVNEPIRTIGATRIEEGVLSVSKDDALPTAMSISSNAVLDICGVRQTVQAPWGDGTIRSTSATPGTLALVCNDNRTLGGVYSSVSLEKLGSGTLTAKGTFGDEITVGEGKLVLAPVPADAKGPVRYWRFKVDDIRGNPDMMQFSEVKLLSFGTNVTGAASVTYDTVHNPEKSNGGIPFKDAERPELAYDNNTSSKWLDYRAGKKESQEVRDSVWLKFDFGENGMLVTGYEWWTAGDASERDPVSWRLQRSDDGENWEDVDVQTGYDVTTSRKALAYRYENPALGVQVRPLKKLTVAPGATLEIDGIDVVAESISASAGAITFANGGTLTQLISVGDSETRTVRFKDGDIPAGAGLEKIGGGTATVTGLSGMTGAVAVDGGVLQIAAAPALSDAKYFRFTVKKTYGSKYLQLSELYLYDSQKNRVNLNLNMAEDGSSVSSLAAGSAVLVETYKKYSGSESPAKLFDGNTGTKFCRTKNLDNANDDSTWCAIVMRLADGAAPVAYYAFRTAGDATPERNPKTWTMEASLDGSTWELVDEHIDDTNTPTQTNTDSAYYEVSMESVTDDPDSKFFRFTVKKTYGDGNLQMSEFSLYDAENNRLNVNLVHATDGSDASTLAAGSYCACGSSYAVGHAGQSDEQGVWNAFDGDLDTKWCLSSNLNAPSDSSTWRSVVIRLPDDAARVASYSFTTAKNSGEAPARNPSVWTLESSTDGAKWVTVDKSENHENPGATPTGIQEESQKFQIQWSDSSQSSSVADPAFAAGSTVSVASGARLALDDGGASVIYGLSIDAAAGAGTIENFKAAASGVIYLTNVTNPSSLARSGVDLITFENCPVRPSFAGWTVYVNGQPTSYRVKATDTGLQLSSLGLTIILR
ncbi:MAG: hypothetical protein IJG18_05345 [Kiritimatiellae bacterium]|nr:hypothetical protein [Kiritimatiellia bacterium]